MLVHFIATFHVEKPPTKGLTLRYRFRAVFRTEQCHPQLCSRFRWHVSRVWSSEQLDLVGMLSFNVIHVGNRNIEVSWKLSELGTLLDLVNFNRKIIIYHNSLRRPPFIFSCIHVASNGLFEMKNLVVLSETTPLTDKDWLSKWTEITWEFPEFLFLRYHRSISIESEGVWFVLVHR